MNDMRCTVCSFETTLKEVEEKGLNACPQCGSTGTPMSISQDTQIKINWHELRCLTIWASNYVEQHCTLDTKRALKGILDRLRVQRKEGLNWGGLTLEDDFKDLQKVYPDSQMLAPDGKVLIDKKVKQ